jgi:hypothetical protein
LVTGGTVTVLEPDWNSLVVEGDRGPTRPGWLTNARHPGVGAELWSLLHDAGCEVIDRIEELSVWRTLGVLEAILGGVAKACAAAVAAGRVDHETASRWLEEQDRREREDAFVAYMPKILVVARRRH